MLSRKKYENIHDIAYALTYNYVNKHVILLKCLCHVFCDCMLPMC